jgi:RimJ/RimL family protein N-acetyltransferase
MPYYSGEPYADGQVTIGPPDLPEIARLPLADDVRADVELYLHAAPTSADIEYFAITSSGRPVGQIMLHDIDLPSGESLVGYHLFSGADRGQGIGTRALRLLQRHVAQRTTLRQLTIITTEDNLPSQALARTCGFADGGPAREGPPLLVFRWAVRR